MRGFIALGAGIVVGVTAVMAVATLTSHSSAQIPLTVGSLLVFLALVVGFAVVTMYRSVLDPVPGMPSAPPPEVASGRLR